MKGEMIVLVNLIGIAMILSAIAAVRLKNLISSIIAVGVMGLMASVIYLFLSAPDVAMTEAAIGSALSVAIYLYSLKKMGIKGDIDD